MTGKHTNIRARAAEYAKIFLAQKYKEEYQELYRAYLTNRGVPVREQKNVIDERLLVNNIKAGN
jgi:hypothetical protein